MGIDRHELEHRNWRPSASKINNELDRELVEQLETSIVPDDSERASLVHDLKKVRRETADQH